MLQCEDIWVRLGHIAPGSEFWPNSANLNYYADGIQSVGWHSDDENLFGGKRQELSSRSCVQDLNIVIYACMEFAWQDCSIISLSLGGRREFWTHPKLIVRAWHVRVAFPRTAKPECSV